MKSSVHANCGCSKEVVFDGKGLGLLYLILNTINLLGPLFFLIGWEMMSVLNLIGLRLKFVIGYEALVL